jgi:hypothetical protein
MRTGGDQQVTIGGSIALIIIGAILRFAVTWAPNGIDLQIVGVILIIGGVVGLIISLGFLIARRRRSTATQVYEERRYTEPPGGGYGGSAGGGYTQPQPPGHYPDPGG